MKQLDHAEGANRRAYSEYLGMPKLIEWVKINGHLANDLEQAFQDISASYDIDSATTHELDVLWRLVGAKQGGGELDGLESYGNDVYRILIRSKIAKNNSDATIDGIILSAQFIMGGEYMSLIDSENMGMRLTFKSLTELQKIMLSKFDIIPKPQGVRFSGFIDEAHVAQLGNAQLGRSQLQYKFGGK